jgi:cyclic pyranopterin phosphate synthase
MPEEGIDFQKKEALLSYEEIIRLVSILAPLGIEKIRITGGEPLLRKNVMHLFKQLNKITAIKKMALTTNGTITLKYLDELIEYGVNQINLSIDSLDKQRFYKITRRDSFETVWEAYQKMLIRDIDLKLNCVVMKDQNIEDLIPMVALGEKDKVSIRFIEEMPFNGTGKHYAELEWNYKRILEHIESHYGKVEKLVDEKHSTSLNYRVPGFKGSFGIIPAYSRTFCGTCNRMRLTPEGIIKTCLYDDGVFNVKDLMRAGATDDQLVLAIQEAIGSRAKDGFEAEANRNNLKINESMSSIGG